MFIKIDSKDSNIELKDDAEVNAKSIMGVITMAAGYNSNITLRTDGTDEVQCADAIVALFESKFEEE